MKFTATGDSLIIKGYPEGGYDGFLKVKEFISRGDARFNNLETTLIDGNCFASTFCGGTWVKTESRMADKVTGFGFNFLGLANNHIMDYGADGLLETVSHLKERGIAFAGAGEDLHAAEKPAYLDVSGERVAFISVCSSLDDPSSPAGNATKTIKGRPGLNPLRYDLELQVTKEHFDVLCGILDQTKLIGEKMISIKNGFQPAFPEDATMFGDTLLCKVSPDGVERVVTHPKKRDLDRILEIVKGAKKNADYVVVMLHSHEIKGDKMNAPAQFAEEFARAVIDCGADMVIGGGTHELKPIEVYNGKPIFYSLGNFVFQSNMIADLPADYYEKYGYSKDLSAEEALSKRSKGWTIGLHAQKQNFLSVIPLVEFDGEKLKSIELMPIELGFSKPREEKGIPYPANEEDRRAIFKTLKDLSAPYGTALEMTENGYIKVKV